jgi:NitT/TauT family transport system ATP-binding protein
MSPSTTTAVELVDLSVTFRHGARDVAALDQVTLSIPRGEFLVLIGPSGEGKSTLLSTIAGLITPSGGQVLVAGQPVNGPGADRGLVFQQDTTFPWMRVGKHVAYGLASRPDEERERIVAEYLDAVGLADFRSSWPKELSGGMRKRLAIATAFAANPGILLMDEPFGSLDFVTRARLHEIVLGLWLANNTTIVFVTHDVDEALLLADRIVVLKRGRVEDDIPVAFPRPRRDDLRADPDAVALRRHLLGALGLAPEVLT